MKSQLYFFSFLIVALFLISNSLLANHAAGGSIRYTHLQGNQYAIDAELYRDCVGDQAPGTVTVYISSVSCGITDSLVLDPMPNQSGQEVYPPCPGQPTTCQGGIKPGIQRWEYEKIYSFPGQCSDWIISASIAHRNAAITTIQNPAGTTLYLEARLNNLTGDNSSVDHSVDILTFICVGQATTYNVGAVDMDGDSLAFELIPARIDANTNVTYLGSYSAQDPISGSQSAVFDASTGDLSLYPNTIEAGLMVIRVLEYRSGVLMGSVMYEGEIYTVPCANVPPVAFPQFGLYDFSVLPGHFCFQIYTSDADTSDTLSVTYNGGIPDATFTINGAPFPVGTFCWDPDSADVRPQPYTFTISVIDNSCPFQGLQGNF